MLAFSYIATSSKEKLKVLSQCTLHFWEQRKKLGIVCENEEAKNFVESYFWKYPPHGFLPLELYDSNAPSNSPILLSYDNQKIFEHVLFLATKNKKVLEENQCAIFLLSKKEEEEALAHELGTSKYTAHENLEEFFEDIYSHF